MSGRRRGDVQVVAHRGSSGVAAEHTLAAYELAVAEGADALECDVRLTRDGVLVCVHDRKVNRTSDGRGVVSTLELAELAELDFASWKDAQRGEDAGRDRRRHRRPYLGRDRRRSLVDASPRDRVADGRRDTAPDPGDDVQDTEEVDTDADRRSVLTLERLVQLALSTPAASGRPLELHVETKHPTRYGGLVERCLVELLQRYGLACPASRSASQVTVMSYAPTSLRRVHAMAPALPTVFLMDRVPVRYRSGGLPDQVSAAGPRLSILKAHPGYVQRVHARGARVHCFTADEPVDIDYLLDLGVDAVISNHPRRVLQQLGRLAG